MTLQEFRRWKECEEIGTVSHISVTSTTVALLLNIRHEWEAIYCVNRGHRLTRDYV